MVLKPCLGVSKKGSLLAAKSTQTSPSTSGVLSSTMHTHTDGHLQMGDATANSLLLYKHIVADHTTFGMEASGIVAPGPNLYSSPRASMCRSTHRAFSQYSQAGGADGLRGGQV